jgi:hypothetical protein
MSNVLAVGVVVSRRQIGGRWGGEAWHATAILTDVPAAAPGTWITADDLYAGDFVVDLNVRAVPFYRDNLETGRPSVWVALAVDHGGCRVVGVTVDPDEGEALSSDTGLVVDALAMPDEIRTCVADYVAAHPVVLRFEKRKRRRHVSGDAA